MEGEQARTSHTSSRISDPSVTWTLREKGREGKRPAGAQKRPERELELQAD